MDPDKAEGGTRPNTLETVVPPNIRRNVCPRLPQTSAPPILDNEPDCCSVTPRLLAQTLGAEPARLLINNEHFKAYVADNGVESQVRAQLRRERKRAGRS